jgi:hypothetical protein
MPARYSSRDLPAAAYIPGVTPRAQRPPASRPRRSVDFAALASDDDFRFGIDLFNHGFPWEAHEVWEGLWRVAPRELPERALLHGLIQVAAAALKVRAGLPEVARDLVISACGHLRRAAGVTVFDVPALVRALHAWAADVTQPPPVLVLNDEPRATGP